MGYKHPNSVHVPKIIKAIPSNAIHRKTFLDVNEAYDRVEKGDVKYRFVIDMETLKQEASAE